MSLLNEITHIKFFHNKEFNHFYLAVFIMTFGGSLINIFVPIYFYNLGFSIEKILFFYFLVSLYFVILSYLGAQIVARIGEKHSIFISAPFIIIYYIGLIYIDSYDVLFYLLPLFLSLRMIFFNYGYHLNFINHSEKKRRGRELAMFGAVTLIATVLAPYIGSVISEFNFAVTFIVSSCLIVVGNIPLFFSPDKYEKVSFTFSGMFKHIFQKKSRGNLISFSGYAIESVISRMIWPIFLVILLGTITKTGFLISASMLISLFSFYFIGRITDKVDKVRLLKIGTFLYFFAWIARLFVNSAYKVLFIDSYKNLSEKILHLPWQAHGYDLAKKGNYFEFIVSREVIFNSIRVIMFPVLILVFSVNFYPFMICFLIASVFSLGYIFINK